MGTRIGIGFALAALFIVMLYLGPIAQVVLFTLGAMLSVYEMNGAFLNRGYQLYTIPAYAFAAIYATWVFFLPDLPWAILLFAAVVAVILERICNEKRSNISCFASIGICIYPLSLFAVLTEIGVGFGYAEGIAALLVAFACPLMGDTFAYFIGSLFGKRKLCPGISPKKTVAGGVASLIGGTFAGWVIFISQPLWGTAYPIAMLLVLGVICGVLGQAGDLFASLIKRWTNIKDFGSIFPGHGGILDRLDSVLMCAPAVYISFLLWSMWK